MKSYPKDYRPKKATFKQYMDTPDRQAATAEDMADIGACFVGHFVEPRGPEPDRPFCVFRIGPIQSMRNFNCAHNGDYGMIDIPGRPGLALIDARGWESWKSCGFVVEVSA